MNVASMIPVNISLVILAMMAVNAIILGICICRLKEMRKGVRARVKAQYLIGAVVSTANGFAPIFFQQWPNTVGLMFAAWVCYTLWSDGYQWKNGPPLAALMKKESQDEAKAE